MLPRSLQQNVTILLCRIRRSATIPLAPQNNTNSTRRGAHKVPDNSSYFPCTFSTSPHSTLRSHDAHSFALHPRRSSGFVCAVCRSTRLRLLAPAQDQVSDSRLFSPSPESLSTHYFLSPTPNNDRQTHEHTNTPHSEIFEMETNWVVCIYI